MFGNDRIGDCTCAAVGHLLEAWSANEGVETVPSDASILSAYSSITGYDPATGRNDTGADLLSVCQFWAKQGSAKMSGGIAGNVLSAFAEVPAGSQYAWQQAIYLFGGLYIGLNLPESAERQLEAGQEWDVALGWWPSVGGHCVAVHGYDPGGVIVSTWGQLHRATWRFVAKYCDEAYALLDTAWCPSSPAPWYVELYDVLAGDARPPAAAPNGLDWATLQSDLASLEAQ